MNHFPTLHTERLDLIGMQQSHLNDIFRLFGDEEVTRFYHLLPLKEEQEGQKLLDWFRNRYQEGQGIRWGIALKGKSNIIGTIGFNNYTKNHHAKQ
jgi:ribosomal-protein-alanine N-acetyltransferase